MNTVDPFHEDTEDHLRNTSNYRELHLVRIKELQLIRRYIPLRIHPEKVNTVRVNFLQFHVIRVIWVHSLIAAPPEIRWYRQKLIINAATVEGKEAHHAD